MHPPRQLEWGGWTIQSSPPGFTNDFNYYYYYSNQKVSLLTLSFYVSWLLIIIIDSYVNVYNSRNKWCAFVRIATFTYDLPCFFLVLRSRGSAHRPSPPASIINLRHWRWVMESWMAPGQRIPGFIIYCIYFTRIGQEAISAKARAYRRPLHGSRYRILINALLVKNHGISPWMKTPHYLLSV